MFFEEVKFSGVVDYEYYNVCDMYYFLCSVFLKIIVLKC